MALDEDGEKAAAKLAKMPDVVRRYPHDRAAVQAIKNVLYDYDTEDSTEDVVRRAIEIASAATARSGSSGGPGSGKGRGPAKGQRPKDAIPFDRLSQPYRFIDLPDKIGMPEAEAAGVEINSPMKEGYCATITVDWIAESPLLIGGASVGKQNGNGIVTPLKIGGTYVIPGATLRGLTRSITEIVSYAKMTQGNWHYRFGLRDFVHPYYASEDGVSKVTKVRGGFLTIRPAGAGDDNRHVVELDGKKLVYEIAVGLDWGHVKIPSLKAFGVRQEVLRPDERNGRTNYPEWTKKPLDGNDGKYAQVGMIRQGQIDFTVKKNFRLVSNDDGKKVYEADTNGAQKGVLVFAGKLPGGGNKVFEYFVVPNDAAKKVKIDKDVAMLFERLYSRPGKGDKLDADGNWKILRKLAEKPTGIPVFYVGDPAEPYSNFFFGLTRLFKIPHRSTVGQMLYDNQPAHKPLIGKNGYENVDFAENLFGYVMEERDWVAQKDWSSTNPSSVARKGRVSFGFAMLNDATKARESSQVDIIQMAPRASFSPFYLRGEEKDYSGSGSKIAGRKAYFPRYESPAFEQAIKDFQTFGRQQAEDVAASSNGNRPSQDVYSNLKFLVPQGDRPLIFTGEIRLHNVTAAEIGAVLFALTHGGDTTKSFRHMVGRGKPIGAGQMRIGRVELKAEANLPSGTAASRIRPLEPEERYDAATGKGFGGEDGHSLAPFIDAFEEHMRKQIGPSYPMQSPTICEWLGMSDPTQGAKEAATGRLYYKPYDVPKAFDAYRKLRQATQAMNTSDKPLGPPRLLSAPPVKPKR